MLRRTNLPTRLPAALIATAALIAAVVASPAVAGTGGTAPPGSEPQAAPTDSAPNSGVPGQARLSRDRRTALPPPDAPLQVRQAIEWANRITRKPYRYGGGHRSFNDSAYDCSGTVSYALRGVVLENRKRIIARPLDSRSFASWGVAGPGEWITIYTNPGHMYAVIAGLRFDTSGRGEKGPRWRPERRSSRGYRVRHYPGL